MVLEPPTTLSKVSSVFCTNAMCSRGMSPVCCAAALASIELVVTEALAGNARRMGAVLHERLRALQSSFPQIGSVDGKGLVAGVACVAPGTQTPDDELAWQLVERCVEKG